MTTQRPLTWEDISDVIAVEEPVQAPPGAVDPAAQPAASDPWDAISDVVTPEMEATDTAGDMAGAAPREAPSRFPHMLANGFTFGLMPRITAAFKSGAISGPEYEARRNLEWRRDDMYRDENPVTAFAGEVIGSLPTSFIPGLGATRVGAAAAQGANRAAQGLTMAQRLGRAAGFGQHIGSTGAEAGAMGAKIAGITGALSSREEDIGSRAMDSVTSMPLGYAAGRVGDLLLRPFARVAEHVDDASRVGGNADLGAVTGLRRAMERDGTSPQAIRDAILPDTGRMQVPPGARETILTAYGDAGGAANDAAARAAARQAYQAYAAAQGVNLRPSTLDGHVNRIVRSYVEEQGTIPLALDEAARLTGSRGQNLSWARRAAQSSPGEAREQLFDNVLSRQEDIIPTIRGRVTDRVGSPDLLGNRDRLVAVNRAREDALYGMARQNEVPFDLSRVFDEVDATMPFRAGRTGELMDEARAIMRGRPDAQGNYPRHTIDTYIQARGELRDLIDRSHGVDPTTGMPRPTSATAHLINLRDRLDEVVSQSNPNWRRANDITRQWRGVEDAMADGRKVKLTGGGLTTDEIVRDVERLNQRINQLSSIQAANRTVEQTAELGLLNARLDAYRDGFAYVLHKELDRLGDTHDVSKLFLKGGRNADTGPRRIVRAFLGDYADRFLHDLQRAQTAGSTYKQMFNSQTTPLRETIDEAKYENRIAGMMRALSYITSPREMFRDVGEMIGSRLSADRNAALARRLSTTTESPGDLLRLLNELDQNALPRRRAFTSEPVNAYSIGGQAGGAFANPITQDQYRED